MSRSFTSAIARASAMFVSAMCAGSVAVAQCPYEAGEMSGYCYCTIVGSQGPCGCSSWQQATPDGCCVMPYSPILISLSGQDIELSDARSGVLFHVSANGSAFRFSWTLPRSDDAWLVLDRNHNGQIDDFTEMFGNLTPQPTPPPGRQRNGFLALAVYDRSENGGNGNGVIDGGDTIFSRLRLWIDSNHNGVVDNQELFRLSDYGITAIELDYTDSQRQDQHGNQFRYRAKVHSTDERVGRWAWDVFLQTEPGT